MDNTPKIVAGLTQRCRDLATSFYSQFVREVVTTSTMREAEMAKLIENTFRQVNIALVNELAIMAHEIDVDIWEALQAASTKPFGYLPFWPGPGVGGHCISIDPSYLSWRADQQVGQRIAFIEHANDVNNSMPKYVVSRIAEALNDSGKALKGSRILCVGLAYKAGVNDLRESPAMIVAERLLSSGAVVAYHDPFVPEVQDPRATTRVDAAHAGGARVAGLRRDPDAAPGAGRDDADPVVPAGVRLPRRDVRSRRPQRRSPVASSRSFANPPIRSRPRVSSSLVRPKGSASSRLAYGRSTTTSPWWSGLPP